MSDIELANEAFNKLGYMVMSNNIKRQPIGTEFEFEGYKFKVIGYATEEEAKKFCDIVNMPFTARGEFHHKVTTD